MKRKNILQGFHKSPFRLAIFQIAVVWEMKGELLPLSACAAHEGGGNHE